MLQAVFMSERAYKISQLKIKKCYIDISVFQLNMQSWSAFLLQ